MTRFSSRFRRPKATAITLGSGPGSHPHPHGATEKQVARMTAGETVTLRSTPPGLGINPMVSGMNAGNDNFDVLELRASATLASVGTVPAGLVPMQRMTDSDASVRRDFQLDGFTINSEPMSMSRIDEVVTVGTTELRPVTNGMSMSHSFHDGPVRRREERTTGRRPAHHPRPEVIPE